MCVCVWVGGWKGDRACTGLREKREGNKRCGENDVKRDQ